VSDRFIATKQHRRFVEFADTIKRNATIGLCYGPAGVGKTLSARRYSHWDGAEEVFNDPYQHVFDNADVNAALHRSRSIFYTPAVSETPKNVAADIKQLLNNADMAIDEHARRKEPRPLIIAGPHPRRVKLIVIDEAERLNPIALEHIRDRFDRETIGVILIGMPGIERRFARYPQLYSRVGFAHHYTALTGEELRFVLTRHWRKFGAELDIDDFTDTQAIAAIARLTGGNFRLIQRLFAQIARVLTINDLSVITSDVVEAASSTLVLGAT
jgi:DNA transposition AAA+ family ATPase